MGMASVMLVSQLLLLFPVSVMELMVQPDLRDRKVYQALTAQTVLMALTD